MASQRQILANRENSKRSTGPRTRPGKAHSRMNAVKHGLTAQKILLPGESPEEFKASRAELYREHNPTTASERELVDLITTLQWRLSRAASFEASLLNPDTPAVGGIVIRVDYVEGGPDPDLPQNAENSDDRDMTKEGGPDPGLGETVPVRYTEDGHKIADTKEYHVPPPYQAPRPLASKLSDLDQVDRHQTSLLNALIKAFHLLFVLQSRRLTAN